MPLFILALLFIPTLLWRGFVLVKLWTWFLVPLGAPAPKVPLAMGLLLLHAHLTLGSSANDGDFTKRPDWLHKTIGFSFVAPALLLGVAWAIRLFVA